MFASLSRFVPLAHSGFCIALMFGRSLRGLEPKVGANVSQPNVQGMTPLAVATQNKQEATMQILKAHGAQ